MLVKTRDNLTAWFLKCTTFKVLFQNHKSIHTLVVIYFEKFKIILSEEQNFMNVSI